MQDLLRVLQTHITQRKAWRIQKGICQGVEQTYRALLILTKLV